MSVSLTRDRGWIAQIKSERRFKYPHYHFPRRRTETQKNPCHNFSHEIYFPLRFFCITNTRQRNVKIGFIEKEVSCLVLK